MAANNPNSPNAATIQGPGPTGNEGYPVAVVPATGSDPFPVEFDPTPGETWVHYKWAAGQDVNAGVDFRLLGLKLPATSLAARLYRIDVILDHRAAGNGTPIMVNRALGVSGVFKITEANIAKTRTGSPDSTLEIWYDNPSVTSQGVEAMLCLGGSTITTLNQASPSPPWVAESEDDMIELLPSEGLIFITNPITPGDADNLFWITLHWKERVS